MDKKRIILFIILILVLGFFIEKSLSKYSINLEGPTFSLDIIAPAWADVSTSEYNNGGFENISMVLNSRSDIIVQATPKNNSWERFWFPIEVEIGEYYKISFIESKTYVKGNNGSTDYENNSNSYIYGCTVTDNLDWAVSEGLSIGEKEGFYWKEDFLDDNYKQYQIHGVCLTFKATSSKMYWLWEFSNIRNGITLNFNISNIIIEKITEPTSGPYIKFIDTSFNTWKMDEERETDVEHPHIKDTYITTATENSLDLRIETGEGWEFINIPIHGLVEGNWYTIDYNELTTNCTINNTNCYASFIQQEQQKSSKQVITSSTTGSSCNIIKANQINKLNTHQIVFQATAETMYWVWQCGGINNYNWARIQLTNVQIHETTN